VIAVQAPAEIDLFAPGSSPQRSRRHEPA